MFNKKIIISLWVVLFLFPVFVFSQECPDCPGDFNGDKFRDFKDFAVFANYWLMSCSPPEQLPVFDVTEAGVPEGRALILAESLGISPEQLSLADGVPMFIDPKGFQQVPTLPVNDPVLIRELTNETEADDQESPLVFEAFDFEGILQIRPFPEAEALNLMEKSLSEAGLLPENGEPFVEHSMFEVFDAMGKATLPAVQLDTRVNYNFSLNRIPLIGPGAQLSITFGPSGNPTQLLFARRGTASGQMVNILSPAEAIKKFVDPCAPSEMEADAKLVYYAPPLSKKGVKSLLPYYDVGGIAYGPEGQQANKLRKLIPATDDRSYVPSVQLIVIVKGSLVNAEAIVQGGLEPYSFSWASSSADLSGTPDDVSKIEYNANPRNEAGNETVEVIVTDDNGTVVSASKTVFIGFAGIAENNGDVVIEVGGIRDFGVERAVSDLCAANQSGFVNRFLNDGVTKRFNWSGLSSWERDFKEGATGLDHLYVDNVDITFYCGHGYGGGFTFEGSQDDGYLTYNDAAGAWGDGDLEYLALLSCQVLRDTYDSKKWYTRWGPSFNGLHLLCGFQTNAYDWSNFGPRFADYMLGRQIGFITITLPVRAAWFAAKHEEQPASVESVVMGVVGPGGVISGYNDYFWGKGPVGPDLRGSNIHGYWRIVYK